MSFLSSPFRRAPNPALDVIDHGFIRDIVEIPSRDFFGFSSKSPNGRYTIAWCDGGPDQARQGRYFLLEQGRIVAEGKMARPNDGKVADNGVFILNDWGAVERLSGTFSAFNADGTLRFSRDFGANLLNNGLNIDGSFAACQTANAPHPDGGSLFTFDLIGGKQIAGWHPESGWASSYEFSDDGKTVCLNYGDRGAFRYTLDGLFVDRMLWLASGLQLGDLAIVETLLFETEASPPPALVEQLLDAIDRALAAPAYTAPKLRARALKFRGICFEAIAEVGPALAAYDQALALDSRVGVKRKAEQLRKVITS